MSPQIVSSIPEVLLNWFAVSPCVRLTLHAIWYCRINVVPTNLFSENPVPCDPTLSHNPCPAQFQSSIRLQVDPLHVRTSLSKSMLRGRTVSSHNDHFAEHMFLQDSQALLRVATRANRWLPTSTMSRLRKTSTSFRSRQTDPVQV